jgi:catechol 2,3-dioxygenase-like lactoylglutathione lyase family enzyme
MRIDEITLFTTNIPKQKHFYKTVLGFEILTDSKNKISFKTGASVLTFEYDSSVNPSHLAFNIPFNAINDALIWLKKRTDVISYNNTHITEFENPWDAKSIYFYDDDKNIMEFIARERIEIESDVAFSPQSILSISEIAIGITEITPIYNTINTLKSIPVFSGDLERFCALGDDQGLFILINKTLKKWYPTSDTVLTANFKIKGDYNFSFRDGKIKEIS